MAMSSVNIARLLSIVFLLSASGCSHREIPYSDLAAKIDSDPIPEVRYEGSDSSFHYMTYRASMGAPVPIPQPVSKRKQRFKFKKEQVTVRNSFKRTTNEGDWRIYRLGIYGHDQFYRDFVPSNDKALPRRAEQVRAR